jgi:hypothetical protein
MCISQEVIGAIDAGNFARRGIAVSVRIEAVLRA